MGKYSVESHEFGFKPNEYQEKIFDWVLHGNGNAVVKALAGTGKTSTAIACMSLIQKSQKCIFLAFNKTTADEINTRMGNKCASTVHSLGYAIIRRNIGGSVILNNHKYDSYLKRNIGSLSEAFSAKRLKPSQKERYVQNISDLIHFSRCNLCQTAYEIRIITEKYGIRTLLDEPEVVEKCLMWGKENNKEVDFDDMVWLPNELSLDPRGLQYDWIIFDEGQDASKSAIQLFLKCLKRGGRFMILGDENQQIYMFSGADPDAFKFMCEYPNTSMFDLPITYRCAREIVKAAKSYAPNLIARKNAPKGKILHDCKRNMFKDGDMVLCRTNAPLIKLYTELINNNVQCYINGKDIGMNLVRLLDKTREDKISVDLSSKGVIPSLYKEMFRDTYAIMMKYGITKDDAFMDNRIMEQYDMITNIISLSNGIDSKKELIDKITGIFSGSTKGIMLSTIHKAKGMEADNVYIACPSTIPSKKAKLDWEIKQEENLLYVAITRAKRILGFVDENDVRPCGSLLSETEILSELHMTELKVFGLYDATNEIIDDKGALIQILDEPKHMKDLSGIVNMLESNMVKLSLRVNQKDDNGFMEKFNNYLK